MIFLPGVRWLADRSTTECINIKLLIFVKPLRFRDFPRRDLLESGRNAGWFIILKIYHLLRNFFTKIVML